MTDDYLDALKESHGYGEWRNRNTLDENLFVLNFALRGNELPGWEPHRIQRAAAPASPYMTRAEATTHMVTDEAALGVAQTETPTVTQSIWKRPEGGAEALVRVDVFECASRPTAHECLVQLLGQFQAPLSARRDEPELGDIAFVGTGGAAVLFARANLVVLVRNAGRTPISIIDIARQIDRDLISKPEGEGRQIVPKRTRTRARAEATTAGMPLDLETLPSMAQSPMYKVFSRVGEVAREQGDLVYRPAATGSREVTIYTIPGVGDDALPPTPST